jgi:hypothetical protein
MVSGVVANQGNRLLTIALSLFFECKPIHNGV